jgi:thioredoxin-like negative regulator of GroEL
MIKSTLLMAAAAFAGSVEAAKSWPKNMFGQTQMSEQVKLMTTSNYYEDFIDANTASAKEPCLVMFHTDWCPHCVELIPEWNKLA